MGNRLILFLLDYEGGGRWLDVAREAVPTAFDTKLAYTLPRQGRSIKMWGSRGPKALYPDMEE